MAEIISSEVGYAKMSCEYGSFKSGDFVTMTLKKNHIIGQVTEMQTRDKDSLEATIKLITDVGHPVPEGCDVRRARDDEVINTLDIPKDGLSIGSLQENGSVPVRIGSDQSVQKHFGIYGRTDTGKSYTSTVLIKELLSENVQIVVVDPHGEYAERINSTYEQDIVTEYCENEDFSYMPSKAEDIESLNSNCMKIIDDEVSVLNLAGIKQERKLEILDKFIYSLYEKRIKGDIGETKVFIDEADNFAGKSKDNYIERIDEVASEGRKFGFTICLITQRPSNVDTDVRSQMQFVLLHKLTDGTDIDKAISSSEGIDSSWSNRIEKLSTGESILTGDLVKTPIITDIRELQTEPEDDSKSQEETDEKFKNLRSRNKTLEKENQKLKERISDIENTDKMDKISNLQNELSQVRVDNRIKESKIQMIDKYVEFLEGECSSSEYAEHVKSFFLTIMEEFSQEMIEALNWFRYNKKGKIRQAVPTVNESELRSIKDNLLRYGFLTEDDSEDKLQYNYRDKINEYAPESVETKKIEDHTIKKNL